MLSEPTHKEDIMDKPRLILDPGSTHGGDISQIAMLINRLGSLQEQYPDVDISIKPQLFMQTDDHTRRGNRSFDYDLTSILCLRALDRGIGFMCSVFDDDAIEVCKRLELPAIKFAYSQGVFTGRISKAVEDFDTVYMSGDHQTQWVDGVVKLFCIPEYPVYQTLDMHGIFGGDLFDGFSDHTLGTRQTVYAIKEAGVRIIEKHVQCPYSIDCPDARFAIGEEQLHPILEALSCVSQ